SPTRDDADALERVEREIRGLTPGSDPLPRSEALCRLAGADHDVPFDRKLLERLEHPGARGLLCALLVGSPEPARARQGRPFGHARVALAEARAAPRLSLVG